MRVDDTRPDPEQLLRRIQSEEREAGRGRLKVFLGYASRVGKSARMLDEGRRRKERGQDVVVAAVQERIDAEAEARLAHFERVPTLREEHDGRWYDVIDLTALFRRHPQLCLIDELAYDNPPGSRNAKRWQDVDELLDRGIGVITAVNLQHIEEHQAEVERVSGKRARYSVPEAFLRQADEIVLVDASSADLLVRRAAPLTPEQQVLSELRERALLLAADVVEAQLKEYLDCHNIPQTWGTHERILVCLTPRSDAEAMLSSGRRNADRFHGSLLACYVEQGGLSTADRALIESHLDFARSLGASVHLLKGSDFASALLDFARRERVTQLFVGHSFAVRKLPWVRTPIERLIGAAEDFDVRLFPHSEARQ